MVKGTVQLKRIKFVYNCDWIKHAWQYYKAEPFSPLTSCLYYQLPRVVLPKQIPHQRRYTDGKQAYEKILHIMCHQENAN